MSKYIFTLKLNIYHINVVLSTGIQCPDLIVSGSNITVRVGYYEDMVPVGCNTGHYTYGNSSYTTTCGYLGEWTHSDNCLSKYNMVYMTSCVTSVIHVWCFYYITCV